MDRSFAKVDTLRDLDSAVTGRGSMLLSEEPLAMRREGVDVAICAVRGYEQH